MALLSNRAVAKRYGGVSTRTTNRWVNDPLLNFPKPIIIRNRNYWAEDELDAFDQRRAEMRKAEVASS